MEKYGIALLALVVLLPACSKKNSSHHGSRNGHHNEMLAFNIPFDEATDVNHFFDEDLGEFVLEEEANPFADNAELVAQAEDNQDISWNVHTEEEEFQTIHFDFDRDTIRKDEKEHLTHNVASARKAAEKGETVIVEGHSCHSAGSAAYNLVLSERRALTVAQAFKDEGIESGAIKTVGRGTEMPVVHGGDRSEQAPNRRVEVFGLAS